MKNEDLKASFGKIQPREELVNSTLVKIREQKEKQNNKQQIFTPSYNRGLRLAGAFCAFALVFCIGYFVATKTMPSVNNGDSGISLTKINEGKTTLDELNTDEVSPVMLSGGEDAEHIDVKGEIISNEIKSVDGQSFNCEIKVSVSEVYGSLSLENVSSIIIAKILFTDSEQLNDFVNSQGVMYLRLAPNSTDGTLTWTVIDFVTIN